LPNTIASTFRTISSFAGDMIKLPPRVQFAALPYRHGPEGVEYLLITSRDTGRWILPKGWPVKNADVRDSVMREAWEEAGIIGHMHGEPAGEFSYDKNLPDHSLQCRVVIYPVQVVRLADAFPECTERKRKWFSAALAARRVRERELRSLFLSGELDALVSGLRGYKTT